MAQRRRVNLNHKLYPVLISSIQTKWTFFWFSIAEKQKCGKSIIFSKKKLKKTVWSHFSTSHIWLHTYTSHTWFVWWKSATMSTSFLSLKKQTNLSGLFFCGGRAGKPKKKKKKREAEKREAVGYHANHTKTLYL